MNTNQSKGKTTGLHRPYFNGSPEQGKKDHPVSPSPQSPTPGHTPKGC